MTEDSVLHSTSTLYGSTTSRRPERQVRPSPTQRLSSFIGNNFTNRNSATKNKTYDDLSFADEQTLSSGVGVRVWYDSYTTIDWIHDAIKETSRLRRLRSIRGVRGVLLNTWDRLQAWIIVTIAGVVTAFIAGGIVMSEAVLFDLKDGYCERNWRLAKRFCCPYAQGPDYDFNFASMASNTTTSPARWSLPYRSALASSATKDPSRGLLTGMGNQLLSGWAAPVAGSPAWKSFALSAATAGAGAENEECPGWVTWGQRFSTGPHESWWADYGMYLLIAVFWASIASLLTIYLTSSELYVTTKNSAVASTTHAHPSSLQNTAQSIPPNHTAVQGDSAVPADADADEATERTALLGSASSASTTSPVISHKVLSQIAHEQRAAQALPPRKVLYFGSGSGIPEVKCILSGFVIHGYLGFWTLFTKAVGLTFSVASGLSLGKEGPFVQIASCVGNIVCRVFPSYESNEAKRREILSCACAAGVAVAFGAPVGGVLFSLEEVSYYFPSHVMFRSFFCAMVAAATLRAIDPFGTGKIVLFQVTYDKDWHFAELPFFILIGLFGGIYGAYFTKLNMAWSKNVRSKTWMAKYPVAEVIMITLITGVASRFNGYLSMGGTELIADLFSECHEHESLDGLCVSSPSQIRPLILAIAGACLAKGLLTIITFGIKLPAGIFIPTLAVGACFGRIVGLLVQYVQWTQPDLSFFSWCPASDSACIVPGVYAMVGAAATLSGVTRTTVSLAVIMFELTGTLTYSVPVMLSVLVAKTVADALEHKGIYDLVIDFSGLPFLDNKAEYVWQGVQVPDAMDTAIEVIWLEQDNTVESLRAKLARLALGSGYTDGGFPIVVKQPESGAVKPVGYIAAAELEHALATLCSSGVSGDPNSICCTFRHIPYSRSEAAYANGSETGGGAPLLRDSLLISNDPADLSLYVDKAPITVQTHSSLELVHQYFTRLGVKTLIVVDERGVYRGIIFKKRYLAFLAELEGH